MKVDGRMAKLRGRLALWLAKPFLRARYDWADLAVKVDHQPDYHKDWWQGQTMSILHVVEDMSRGRVFIPSAEEIAQLARNDRPSYSTPHRE